MIAAAVLTTIGLSPGAAFNHLGEARGLTVLETEQQRSWVLDFDNQSAAAQASLRKPVR